MENFWNERYSEKKYVYGEYPNVFFAAQLEKLEPGSIVLPCEGEGRNSVYAASLGWKVNAFDSSEVAKTKAFQLAGKKDVKINYVIGDALSIDYPENSIDVVALLYAHLPSDVRKSLHQRAIKWLKPGGRVILEAFNTNQLKNTSGGPKDISMLFSEHMLKEDFLLLQTEILQTMQTKLQEGEYHKGEADIIRFSGVKR